MGFVEGNINDMDIKKEIIGSDELIIVTSNPEFNSKRWQLKELANYKWVLREKGSGTREIFLNYISKKIDSLNIFMELGHTESIKSILKHGKTLACISKMAVTDELKSKELYLLDIDDFK